MKLLLSLKHSRKEEEVFTFWRPNNSGYTIFLESSGQYEIIEDGYHDSESTMPIDQETMNTLDKMKRSEHGSEYTVIPINKRNLKILNVEFKKNNLQRMQP